MGSLGFVTAIPADQSLEEFMSLAARHRFDCVEVRCWAPRKTERWYAGIRQIDVVNIIPDTANAIPGFRRGRGVAISGLGYYPNLVVGILATPLKFHQPTFPGFGDVDWGKYFSALTAIRLTGSVCVKVEDHACETTLETRHHSLSQSRNSVRPYLPARNCVHAHA